MVNRMDGLVELLGLIEFIGLFDWAIFVLVLGLSC